MDNKEIESSKRRFESKTDEELLQIWKDNNVLQYSPVSFEAIRQILSSRRIYIPEQSPFDKARMEKELDVPLTPEEPAKPFPFYMIGVCLFAFWIIFSPFIKDLLIQGPEGSGYFSREALIAAGDKRIFLDFVVFCVSAFFGTISVVQLLMSKDK